jgi:hypothetical protein
VQGDQQADGDPEQEQEPDRCRETNHGEQRARA